MDDLMISISGVRGIVGQSLTPQCVGQFGMAFGTWVAGGTVVVGRDTRASGEMVKHALLGGLLAMGCRVIDIGVAATPTATLMLEHLKAAGGVVVSASHNPIEWNALKFFRSDGIYLNEADARELLDLYYQAHFHPVPYDRIHPVEQNPRANAWHVERASAIVDAALIRQARFRVALDAVNGSGAAVTVALLEHLGCTVHQLHCTPNGTFPHYPEPTFVNLHELIAFCREHPVDVGFAQDPDADRLALVSERGEFLGEEMSLALCADYVLAQGAEGPLVVNLSTSRLAEHVARKHQRPLERVPVGEVHVAERMKEIGAAFGGEGNGGVIDPRVHYGRDSLVGIAIMLEQMARRGKKVSELAGALPQYYMVKSKVDCPKSQSRMVLRALREVLPEGQVDLRDGLRLDFADSWVHLRSSNTEPILRLIAEATTPERCQALIAEYQERVAQLLRTIGGEPEPRAERRR